MREPASGVEALTPSEVRVAELAAEGLTNREVAQALFVSEKTVETHLGRVYRKLDIKSRHALPAALGERHTGERRREVDPPQPGEQRRGHRQGHLGSGAQRLRAHPLVRRVCAAAARAEAVDRELDAASRHVARVARPAALGGDDRAPERLGGGSEHLRRGHARVHPGPCAHHARLQPDLVVLRGNRLEHGVKGLETVGAQVAQQLAGGRHDVEGVARAQDRRHRGEAVGAGRVAAGGHELATVASARRALRPFSGADPECEERPWACTWSVAAALRFTITASSPAGRALAGLEAEAGVEVREALGMGERRRAPLLVVHEQDHRIGVQLGPLGQLPHQAERERHAALHVDRTRAGVAVAVAAQRTVRVVRDHRVEVPEQEHPGVAGPAQPPEEVAGVAGRGALQALDLGLGGQEGGASATHSSAPSRSPDGDDTATSASSSRSAASAMREAASIIRAALRSGSS